VAIGGGFWVAVRAGAEISRKKVIPVVGLHPGDCGSFVGLS